MTLKEKEKKRKNTKQNHESIFHWLSFLVLKPRHRLFLPLLSSALFRWQLVDYVFNVKFLSVSRLFELRQGRVKR